MSKKRMSRKERLERKEWQVLKGQQRVRALERAGEILNRLVEVSGEGQDLMFVKDGRHCCEKIDLFDLGVALTAVREALKTYDEQE